MAEITFQPEALNIGPIGRLSSRQRAVFYNKMAKGVVVVVVVASEIGEDGKSEDIASLCGGFFYDNTGNILTSARLLVDNLKSLEFRPFDGKRLLPAKVLKSSPQLDLAIIQPLEPHDTPISFLKFANEEDIRVGMEAISISHSGGYVYTLAIGHISYPCNMSQTRSDEPLNTNPPMRLPRDIGIDFEKNPMLANISDDLQLIQLNNVHCEVGAWGSPVFNPNGVVLGMSFFTSCGMDFCTHAKILRKFIEDWNSQQSTQQKKEEKSKGSRWEKRKRPKKSKGSSTMESRG